MRTLALVLTLVGCTDAGIAVSGDERVFVNTAITHCRETPCGIGVGVDGTIVLSLEMLEDLHPNPPTRSGCALYTTDTPHGGSVEGHLPPSSDIVTVSRRFNCDIQSGSGNLSQILVGDLCRLRTTTVNNVTSLTITNGEETKSWSYMLQRLDET